MDKGAVYDMTGELQEAGRKISKATASQIQTALDNLAALLTAEQKEDEGEQTPAKEASAAMPYVKPTPAKTTTGNEGKKHVASDDEIPPSQTLEDVRLGLQKLIDLLSPKAKEQLEGDGDGDNDAQTAIVQGHIGGELGSQESNTKIQEAKKTSGMICAACKEPVGQYESYCGSCGSNLRGGKGGYCKNCGSSADSSQSNCTNCGQNLKESGALTNVLEAAPANRITKPVKPKAKPDPDVKADKNEDEPKGQEEPDDKEADDAKGHMDDFGNMAPEAQAKHLATTHGSNINDPNLKYPRRRAAMHMAQHSKTEAADIGLEIIDIKTDFISLVEKALDKDGNIQVKMIKPGWGSSGYYRADVLERDAPEVFPTGTKMYLDHPSKQEEKDRPERSVRDIAAITVSDAAYNKNGPDGPGVYATAKPIEAYKSSLEELAPFIGTSIRTSGLGSKGEAEGKKGIIVERLVRTPGTSCDFVTEAGAGGKVLSLLESAFAKAHQLDQPEPIKESSKEDDNDVATDLELKEAQKKIREMEQDNARYREKILLREAKDYAEEELRKIEGLPRMTIVRIAEAIMHEPPTDEDGELDKKMMRAKIKEAVKKETDYLESVLRTGQPRGMGREPSDANDVDLKESWGVTGNDDETRVGGLSVVRTMEADFRRLGLSEAVSKQAAKGR